MYAIGVKTFEGVRRDFVGGCTVPLFEMVEQRGERFTDNLTPLSVRSGFRLDEGPKGVKVPVGSHELRKEIM